MKSILKLLVTATILLSFTSCDGQIENAKTETLKIYGNCEMCKKTIEKAGSQKSISQVEWNENTKLAAITYDSTKTNQEKILKRIALSGYDSDNFLAPNDVYSKLPGCCQYDRKAQTKAKLTTIARTDSAEAKQDYTDQNNADTSKEKQDDLQLNAIFGHYFTIKDALVKTNGNTASIQAKKLVASIANLKTTQVATEDQTVWLKVKQELIFATEHIASTKNVAEQRYHFNMLSKNMYTLIKVSKTETPTYYQFCPMANNGKGAAWLSKEKLVRNPYYGAEMLNCGKITEIIK